MPIVSSELSQDGPQSDGRFWVTEVHTDHIGRQHIIRWLAAVGVDAAAVMLARVIRILEGLEQREIEENMASILENGSEAATTTHYSTPAGNFAVLRTLYKTATRVESVMAGDFLSSLSDANLRAAFDMTQAQVTTLRANKLTPAANIAASIRAQTGV